MKDQVLVDRGEIGPFPGRVKPVRPGLYKRITRKGNVVWSYFAMPAVGLKPRATGAWCKFSGSKAKALRHGRHGDASKHQTLPWIGRVK
jgi:hypothetical protein